MRPTVYILDKFPPQICESSGATYWNIYAFQSTSCPLTDDGQSVQIDPKLATLFFHKLLQKLTKTCSSEFGALTPQRKTVIWVHYYSPSRAQHPRAGRIYQKAQILFYLFIFFLGGDPRRAPIEVKFCIAKQTYAALGHAKVRVNRCNE